jgi:predicted ferric reductase
MDQTTKPNFSVEEVEQQFSISTVFLVLLAVIAGAIGGMLFLKTLLPGYVQSVSSAQPKAFWYLSRASAFVAYFLLWLSMVLGVGVTNKLAARWPGLARANDMHQYVSVLGLVFGLFHGLILIGDQYMNLKVVQILLPFLVSVYRPISVGIGQLAFYLWAIVLFSFYVRKRIGTKAWRTIHFAAYLTLLGALIHGLLSGTDTGTLGASFFYWITGGILLFLTLYRIFAEVAATSEKKQKLKSQTN